MGKAVVPVRRGSVRSQPAAAEGHHPTRVALDVPEPDAGGGPPAGQAARQGGGPAAAARRETPPLGHSAQAKTCKVILYVKL